MSRPTDIRQSQHTLPTTQQLVAIAGLAVRIYAFGMNPESGARFSLERQEQGPAAVTYRLQVELQDRTLVGCCHIELEAGQVRIDANEPVPGWLTTTISGLLRSLWRSRQVAQPEPWPRRLTRWREGEREVGV